jgi:flagellar L-ring protein precursor FlgH
LTIEKKRFAMKGRKDIASTVVCGSGNRRRGPAHRSAAILCHATVLLVIVMIMSGCSSGIKSITTEPPVPERADGVERTPGSLWPGERSNNMLFADRKARYPGDIITVVINEDSSGENKAETETSRDTATTAGIAGITQASPDHRILAKYEIGGSSTNELTGEGNTSRDGTLEARISARVVSVLDNGNLVIQGKKQVTVNAEDQYLVISGIVRTDDISSDNVVLSQCIADATIIYTGEGVVNDKMRPGWMTRIIDWIWPF